MYITKLLFLTLVLISITDGDGTEKTCFQDPPSPTELNLTNDDEKMTRILTTISNTDPHKIIPWIMKIYLSEILGFQDVTVGNYWSFSRRRPHIEVNMERSLEKYFGFLYLHDRPYYTTPIELLGWTGWFIPSSFPNHTNWWQFHDPGFVLRHPIDPAALAMILNLRKFYGDVVPIEGFKSNCTMMLVEFPDKTVEEQIEQKKLYIEMVSLGPDLAKVLTTLLESYPTMFFIYFGMYPSAWTNSTEHFQLMDSPPNDLFPSRSNVFGGDDRVSVISEGSGVKGEILIPLTRYVHAVGDTEIPIIFRMFKNAYFSPQEYIEFARTPLNNEFQRACEWLKENKNRTLQWLKEPEERLIIGVVLPRELQMYFDASIFQILARVRKVAQKYQISSLPPKHLYQEVPKIGENSEYRIAPEEYSQLIGIVGSAWSIPDVTVDKLNRSNETMIVSYIQGVGGHAFSTIASDGTYKYIYQKFFSRFDWRRVAIITDDDPVRSEFLALKSIFLDYNITLFSTSKITEERKFDEIKQIIKQIVQEKVKIIIVDGFMKSIYGIFCAAFHLNMTAEQGRVDQFLLIPFAFKNRYT